MLFSSAPLQIYVSPTFKITKKSPSKSLLWAQVKHAAEPGGTPCLGDTHESETCNEEAKRRNETWGRREVGVTGMNIYFLVGREGFESRI